MRAPEETATVTKRSMTEQATEALPSGAGDEFIALISVRPAIGKSALSLRAPARPRTLRQALAQEPPLSCPTGAARLAAGRSVGEQVRERRVGYPVQVLPQRES